jgi:hypothetical protein
MKNKILNVLKFMYETIVEARKMQAKSICDRYEFYLSQSTDHADLERRQKELMYKGKCL